MFSLNSGIHSDMHESKDFYKASTVSKTESSRLNKMWPLLSRSHNLLTLSYKCLNRSMSNDMSEENGTPPSTFHLEYFETKKNLI